MAEPAAQAVAAADAGPTDEEKTQNQSNMMRMLFQGFMIWVVMQFVMGRGKPKPEAQVVDDAAPNAGLVQPGQMRLKNLFGPMEECELFVHLSPATWQNTSTYRIPLAALRNETFAREEGLELLWHRRVWYEANSPMESVNISLPPFSAEALTGVSSPHILTTMLRVGAMEVDTVEVAENQVLHQSLPLIVKLRELDINSDTTSLFSDDQELKPKKNLSSPKVPYLKTKLEIRPVFDQTVHSLASIQQGPFKKIKVFPEEGFYQPVIFLSDFWLLEKDYQALNTTLEGTRLNLSLSYSVIPTWSWGLQTQMLEQWSVQGEWGITDTQRDSFMLKRLMIDTNPYLLAFSGAFLLLHTVFSLLAFKNDIQFWRKNESMQGLSARSMLMGSVCQIITSLYLLESQETSRLILFNICLDAALSTWKLKKAVKVEVDKTFPFLHFGGQKGYENNGTAKYDDEAIRYMLCILTPLFVGYTIRSALYSKHRGWYSFIVGSAAGGVYTFGFIMMTPQLYINYRLKSVEHLPWRALTYKAMNTFVDDIAALLIDMPMMHRLSCFRDDIIFFVYIYQRWKYAVDKTRPSIWVSQPEVADATTPAVVADDGSSHEPVDGEAVASQMDGGSGASSKAPAAASDDASGADASSPAAKADGQQPRRRKK